MWIEQVQNRLNVIVEELGLPENSLRIEKNLAQDGLTLTSYSVGIFEPDYPKVSDATSKNANVLNIRLNEFKTKKSNLELLINKEQAKRILAPESAEVKNLNSDGLYTHIIFGLNDSKTIDYIDENVRYCLENYSSKNGTFGCCGKFKDCSRLGKCIHENLLYAKGCQYRKNLENGNAFLVDS